MDPSQESAPALAHGRDVRFSDRLRAEAVRAYESSADAPLDDRAVLVAIRADHPTADPERRIALRAARVEIADEITAALGQVRAVAGWTVFGAIVLALIAGAVAARSALQDQTASVFGLVAGLLGVQTLMLGIWIVLMAVGRRGIGGGLLGVGVLNAARWLPRRIGRGRAYVAAVEAAGFVAGRGPIGKWFVSSVSHTLWASANVGMLIVLAASFIGEGYRFRWDSTWLSEPAYERLIETIAVLPQSVGFQTPNAEQIAMSRRSHTEAAGEWSQHSRRAWSWLFFGSVLMYGLAPRAALLFLSAAMRRRAQAGYRLDLAHPGFARLRARMEAAGRSPLEPASHDKGAGLAPLDLSRRDDKRPIGNPAIVGIETRSPRTGWPPDIGRAVTDLGLVDGRDDRERVVGALIGSDSQPKSLVVVCALRASPDRGIARTIARFRREIGSPVFLVLTGGGELAEHAPPDMIGRRLEDWRDLAEKSGLASDHVIEIDLDHLTHVTREMLASVADGCVPERAGARRLEATFGVIGEHAARWSDPVTVKEQFALHRAIGEKYEHTRTEWSKMFSVSSLRDAAGGVVDSGHVKDRLLEAADQVTNLLPDVLRLNPRWMAAGAIAGALGCLSAAVLVSPLAIGALPAWSVLGGAIGAVVRKASGSPSRPENATDNVTFEDAVRGATLFALLLELQGREQSSISRVLERTLGEMDDDDAPVSRTTHSWLDDVRHRFDLALAAESTP